MTIQLSDHFTLKRLLKFVFPSIIMMVFTSIYGVVDGFFVSNFAGKTSFAAVNLIMPFIMITSGLGYMFGTGGSALVSMKLGQKENNTANRYFTMIIQATVLFGTILSVLGFIFTHRSLNCLGQVMTCCTTALYMEESTWYSMFLSCYRTCFRHFL